MITLRWTWILFWSVLLSSLLRSSAMFVSKVETKWLNPVITPCYSPFWPLPSRKLSSGPLFPTVNAHSQAFGQPLPLSFPSSPTRRMATSSCLSLNNVFLWQACQHASGSIKAFRGMITEHPVCGRVTALQPAGCDWSHLCVPHVVASPLKTEVFHFLISKAYHQAWHFVDIQETDIDWPNEWISLLQGAGELQDQLTDMWTHSEKWRITNLEPPSE